MLTEIQNNKSLNFTSPCILSPHSTLCSATFNSEKFWCETDTIHLPAIIDPAQERIVSTLDELMFPFCPDSEDILLTRHELLPGHLDYLRSLGFNFQNRVVGVDIDKSTHEPDKLRHYYYSPYAVLNDWETTVKQWTLTNSLPLFDTVKTVNSKIYSWQLRCDITDKLGASCFSSREVGVESEAILAQGRKVLIKEAFGVSGHGSVLIDGKKALERICRYIENKEKTGGKAAFVVEPFLTKTVDFSCHFSINVNGEINLFGVQRMRNQGFCFNKVEPAEDSLINLLDNQGYFEVVEKIAETLFNDGYYGPVCLDSMLTTDGIVQIVEINARKSMGLINLSFNAHLGNPTERSVLGFYNLRVPGNFTFDDLLYRLHERRILLSRTNCRGAALLNAGGLTVNIADSALPESPFDMQSADSCNSVTGVGRIYFSILSNSANDENDIEKELTNILHETGLKIF